MKKWRKMSEKTVYDNPWLKVVERKLVDHSGKTGIWAVPKKGSISTVFCLTKENKVVVLRQYRVGIDKIILDLPCGLLEKGEKPIQAARRELLEETGFTAEKFIPLGAYAGNSGDEMRVHSFLAIGGRKIRKQNLDAEEKIEVKLLSIKELLEKIRKREFFDSTRIAVVLLALNKLKKIKS